MAQGWDRARPRRKRLLRIFARSAGRLQTTHSLGGSLRTGSPDFLPMLADLRRLQDAGALRITASNGGREARAAIATDVAEVPSLRPVAARVQWMLGVDAGARDVAVVYGHRSRRPGRDEIPLQTRSLLGALLAVAVSIGLPDEDVRALPTVREPGSPKPVIVIRSGAARPSSSYVEIRTDGRWFWTEDADIVSKTGFTVLELPKAIAESTHGQSVPVLTIPTGKAHPAWLEAADRAPSGQADEGPARGPPGAWHQTRRSSSDPRGSVCPGGGCAPAGGADCRTRCGATPLPRAAPSGRSAERTGWIPALRVTSCVKAARAFRLIMRSIVQRSREEGLNRRRPAGRTGPMRMATACAAVPLTFQQPVRVGRAGRPPPVHGAESAATPGSVLPSSHSRKAPPAVET